MGKAEPLLKAMVLNYRERRATAERGVTPKTDPLPPTGELRAPKAPRYSDPIVPIKRGKALGCKVLLV